MHNSKGCSHSTHKMLGSCSDSQPVVPREAIDLRFQTLPELYLPVLFSPSFEKRPLFGQLFCTHSILHTPVVLNKPISSCPGVSLCLISLTMRLHHGAIKHHQSKATWCNRALNLWFLLVLTKSCKQEIRSHSGCLDFTGRIFAVWGDVYCYSTLLCCFPQYCCFGKLKRLQRTAWIGKLKCIAYALERQKTRTQHYFHGLQRMEKNASKTNHHSVTMYRGVCLPRMGAHREHHPQPPARHPRGCTASSSCSPKRMRQTQPSKQFTLLKRSPKQGSFMRSGHRNPQCSSSPKIQFLKTSTSAP